MDSSAVHLRPPSQVNTGYTYAHSSSYGRSLLDLEKERRTAQAFLTPRMSRRSLRLHTTTGHYGDDSPLDSSLNHSNLVYSTSYSAGGPVRRDAKGIRSRQAQQHSVSCSQSVLQTPHLQQQQQQHSQSVHNSSLHSLAASDASLLSSMLDSSCIQERTLVDRIWGLDEDAELMDSSHLADHSTALANSTLLSNGDPAHRHHLQAQTQTSLVNGTMHADRKEALTAYSSSTSSKYASSSLTSAAPATVGSGGAARPAAPSANAAFSPPSTVYHREKSRKPKTGPLNYVWDRSVLLKKRAAASTLFFLTLLYQQVLLRILGQGKAHSSCCRSMNVKELASKDNISGSLCDDCKGKQRLEMSTVFISLSSWAGYQFHMLWRATAYTGSSMLWLGQKAVSAGWAMTHVLLAALWLAVKSPGKTVSDSYGWLGAAWCRLVTFMSLLNVFFLTRCLPKLLKLLLCLLPLFILYGLWWWDSSSLLSVLPAVNMTEWSSSFPLVLTSSLAAFSSSQEPVEGAVEHATAEPAYNFPPTKHNGGQAAVSSIDSERLLSLEHSLSRLWEQVEGSGQKSDQQHAELVQLYQSLEQQLHSHTERASMEPWVAGLLEERLTLLRGEMEEQEEAKREQAREQYLGQQQSQMSRLAEIEILLQNLAAKTEELQRSQETVTTMPAVATTLPAPISVGVDRESHEALLAEVQRLEKALGSVRHDLQGLMGCQGQCERLGSVQDMVSTQVRQEVQMLLYGSQPAGSEDSEGLPEALLQWLSERFVSGADLQTLLASLELRILQNISLQLDQQQQSGEERPCTQSVTQAVLETMGAAGASMTEEHVQLIVKNALKIYSQDRTGLVDYALETGGGSILSTRCSETYETKTALMSLFGLPLWYFSQSPRVVIQPDVHPGNCWAFRGSNGYLVIRLSMKIRPTAFSMEHIPKALAPSGTIISAPRQFTVYGLDDENQKEGKLLGNYTYEEDGDALQTYPVTEENDNSYQIMEVRVLSNWGHQEYTCLYRIRVHGQPCNK